MPKSYWQATNMDKQLQNETHRYTDLWIHLNLLKSSEPNSSLINKQVVESLCFCKHALFLFFVVKFRGEGYKLQPRNSLLSFLESKIFLVHNAAPAFSKLFREIELECLILRTSKSVSARSVLIVPG